MYPHIYWHVLKYVYEEIHVIVVMSPSLSAAPKMFVFLVFVDDNVFLRIEFCFVILFLRILYVVDYKVTDAQEER